MNDNKELTKAQADLIEVLAAKRDGDKNWVSVAADYAIEHGIQPLAARQIGEDEGAAAVEVLDAGQLSVSELASRINDRVQALEVHARKATEYAFEVGQLLIEAKRQVQHGEWDSWLEAHCNLAPRTARAYMRLAKVLPTLTDEKRQHVADLPIREALKAIATDPTPPVKYAPIKAIWKDRTRDEQVKVKSVFSKARQNLAMAEKCLDIGMNGQQAESLRKHLHAVLAQLDELQGDPATVKGGAQ